MGLHRLDLADWLIPDEHLAEQIALKQALWRDQGERVFSALSTSTDAQNETARLIAEHLPQQHPALYQNRPEGLHCTATDQTQDWQETDHPLLPISWCVQEDLCLLQTANAETDYRLTAASLCAPSYWRLLDKIGQTLDDVHGPVPGYGDALSRKVNRFLERIKVNQPVWRGNWSVVTSDRLYQPGDEESRSITDPNAIADECFMRTEYQTLRRLPETGAVLFTIRVTTRPMADYIDQPQVLRDLQTTLAHMTPAQKAYKSLPKLEPALSEWLNVQLAPFDNPV